MKKKIKWAAAAVYSAIIFLTLPYGPDVIRSLSDYLDKNKVSIYIAGIIEKIIEKKVSGYDMIGWIAALVIVITLIILSLKILRSENKFKKFFWFILIFACYGYFMIGMEIPTEKLHFIEYGLLSIFILSALKESVFDKTIYLTACALTYLTGLIDETIQYFLPNRSGEFDDVLWNALACWLVILLIIKCFPIKIEARTFKKNIKICATAILAALFGSSMFLSFISEYGVKIKFDNVAFYSRLTKDSIAKIDAEAYPENSALLNTSDDSNYGAFIDKYNEKDFPFIHEIRVHIFRRDRYLAYYQHYKYMNDLAEGKASGTPEEIKNLPFNNFLYSYILKTLDSKKNITAIDDAALNLYIADMKSKAEEILKGVRKKEEDVKLNEYLSVSYNENRILEKYFPNTLKNSKFLWKNGESGYVGNLLKMNLNKKYTSSVSNRIIAFATKTQINVSAFILMLCLLIFSAAYLKIGKNLISLVFLFLALSNFAGCAPAGKIETLKGKGLPEKANRDSYKVLKINSEKIIIDGIPDEDVWKNVGKISGFFNIKTGEISDRTTAKIIQNSENIYISFECADDYIFAEEIKKDGKVYNDDCVEFFIDLDGFGKKYFEFEVNALNTVFDAEIIYNNGNIDFDKAVLWDCENLETAVNKNKDGYSVEIKIPLISLFAGDLSQYKNVKFNVYRIDRNKEKFNFFAYGKTINWFHEPEYFKRIEF
ncbi:MAG TPA: carbohydrate-binding family 9-like protein [bacterium]|nr:carbohydrate-binding family 9-like protein [bacterium]HPN32313.1 carbohydrate-binding family 9-like protein [bacterium]